MIGGKKLVAKKLASLKKPYEKLKKNLNKLAMNLSKARNSKLYLIKYNKL